MKVLLINGSPNEKGCTYTALSEIVTQLHKNDVETEIFHIGAEPIGGCRACRACFKAGKCVFDNGDGVNECAEKLAASDGLIIGSPVYFSNINGNLGSFLDRLFYIGRSRYAGKPGAAIVSCRRGGSGSAFDRLNKYFTISSMPVVSSQYWNGVHGNTPDEVRQDLEGLQIMRTLGSNMAWLLKCIESGRKNGIDFPAPEPRIGTNFIR